MNLEKIKEALADATEAKKLYEGTLGDDWAFWDGYEAALTYALLHLQKENTSDAT
jgi:hypothetical protein